MALFGFDLAPQAIIVGLFTGLAYSLLAAGLVLVYRATRVINFAHGQIGALCAGVLFLLVREYHWPYLPALAVALGLGALIGLVVEVGVVRRLAGASRLVLLVATLGVSQVVLLIQVLLPETDALGVDFPVPIDRTIELGSVLLIGEHFMVLAAAPAVIIGLALFLKSTPYGIAIRAVARNPEAASLAGINPRRISMLVWVLAGLLSALTAVLIDPLRGSAGGLSVALGPGLLLRALGAGLVGGLDNLPRVLAGGVGIGVLEALLYTNFPTTPGLVDVLLFAAILLMLLRRHSGAEDDQGAWVSAAAAPVPVELRDLWWVRHLGRLVAGAAVGAALLLPVLVTTSSGLFLWSRVLVLALVALSLTVLTGWAGQLSLGQFALVGVGSVGTGALVARGMPFLAAVGYATVMGVLVALAVGAPALRLKGLFLAITTLGFAAAAHGYLFGLSWLLPGREGTVVPGSVGPFDLRSIRVYYYFCLLVLIVAACCIRRLRRTGVGRAFIAVQDNEPAAAAYSLSPTVAKLTAFAVSGGLAALAGGLLAGLNRQFTSASFGPDLSLQMVSMAVIGGLGSVGGALLGAVYIVGLPTLLGDSAAVKLAVSGIGLLALLLFQPDGLVGLALRVRDALFRTVARGRARRVAPATGGVTIPAQPTAAPAVSTITAAALTSMPGSDPSSAERTGEIVLDARNISVAFGGRQALDEVSIRACTGEVVGLIGSNGAGKSTLMNVISGFVPATGTVEVLGVDVTRLAPHQRARAGLGRAFQNAALFANLTVHEAVCVSLEVHERSEVVPSLFALPPSVRAERRKAAEASEIIGFLGLGRYRDARLSTLSTGTRRIVELACLLGMRPRVLLLDEPTAGVAQRETEAFGPLILRIRDQLDATVVIIEHDLPLVMSMSDRIYCLGAGQVIAEGLPEQVRNDPAVIASYLGTEDRAIQRSGVTV